MRRADGVHLHPAHRRLDGVEEVAKLGLGEAQRLPGFLDILGRHAPKTLMIAAFPRVGLISKHVPAGDKYLGR